MSARRPSIDRILEALDVDTVAGRVFWKKVSKNHSRLNGKEAGKLNETDDKKRWVVGIDKQRIQRSHIIFAVAAGEWPTHKVAHKNKDPLDDRFENLEHVETMKISPRASVQVGQRFGLLTVVSECGRSSDKHRKWLCACDCGGQKVWQSNLLKMSRFPSCGCYAREASRVAARTHGGRNTREYSSWRAAIRRCEKPTAKEYPAYGGRGIKFCEEWRTSFEAFRDYMGPRPPNTTLERLDVNGNYEPGNCVWAAPLVQSRNKRASVWLDWEGERLHLAEIAVRLGITYGAAFMRHKRGKLYVAHRV
jgi:hypothetical protein